MAEISDNTPVSPSPLTLTPGRLVFQFVQGGSGSAVQTVTNRVLMTMNEKREIFKGVLWYVSV
jgi:hypothetical protein